MGSTYGNTMHKFISKRYRGKSVPRLYEWVKQAQSILKQDNEYATQEQWQDLCKKIFDSIIESALNDGEFLMNAARIVVEWQSEVSVLSPARRRSINIMLKAEHCYGNFENLEDWQLDLIEKIIEKEQTLKIYIFMRNGINYFWVSVDKPTTKNVYEYSKDYIEVCDKYFGIKPDLNCEFLVLSEDKVGSCYMPEDKIIIEC